MKNIFLFTALLMIISCVDQTTENNNNELQTLKTDKIEKLLPLSYLEGNSIAVFVSNSGEQKEMNYEIVKEEKTRKNGSKLYKAETIGINYVDPNSEEYALNIKGSGNYINDEMPNLYIACSLTQFVTGYMPIITISESGEPILALFHKELSLLDSKFENVFTNYPDEEIKAYGMLYYTTESGIIGFTDSKGVLFVLKEIKK